MNMKMEIRQNQAILEETKTIIGIYWSKLGISVTSEKVCEV